MKKIQLLYVANEITDEQGLSQQELSFFIQVENLAFAKQVDIVWAGEDNVWQILPARYHSSSESNQEYWNALTSILPAADKTLPGNIQFAVRYRVSGEEYWDNHDGLNYHSQANSIEQLPDPLPWLNIGLNKNLDNKQEFVPVKFVINRPLNVKSVSVHWTTDDWATANITPCHLKVSPALEGDENPIQDSIQDTVQIWQGLLNIGDAFRLQYCICCEADDQLFWDNNHGQNYSASRKPLNILILNLHCYQEENQDDKFSQIAKAIDELCVDIVCLQEVAENWNEAQGDWQSNSAKIINDRLRSPYHLHTDWSHLGFDRYREGVAIMSKYPFLKHDSRYVSNSNDPYNIHARKVVMAQIAVPCIGLINCFSSHLSWWKDGFSEQFANLRAWADANHNWHVNATLLCGDFNIKAGSRGYKLVVESSDYEDQLLATESPHVFKKIFRERHMNWRRYLANDHRIDYIFMKKSSEIRVTSARVVFTEQEYGRVSDHEGYLMTFEPK